ncbi:hypothetical protein A1Q1_00249 [Trichosporon asahii var. asahii CBS 2479]|uniref:Uncharacterized protein n=1 Tax=Trichosporon asahii var. asahii (strain ATCC 90039 / CBS 2479 / JCM 2466 / KCTC 7840 / NBRC 103889/ NCYC 2677 / UAMH 7654) TaxID=1186058 RepID=J4UG61_TRIAS|nr:hypothetical protein A1Q1_00249 [Trichosporon asahii var. asahii CBS 2479]EJT50440.1 hypothetical protein A1Q1_00249 [Trichosporon asahii var. asahii CBS 2479]
MARFSALQDSDDIKPDLSDESMTPVKSSKGKRKRSPSAVDSDDDVSTASPQPKEKKPRIKKESKAPGKPSAWSKAQVRQLWDALDMKPGKINWDHVAAQVDGRGKIACRDKWLKMIRPRLEEFIDSMGE